MNYYLAIPFWVGTGVSHGESIRCLDLSTNTLRPSKGCNGTSNRILRPTASHNARQHSILQIAQVVRIVQHSAAHSVAIHSKRVSFFAFHPAALPPRAVWRELCMLGSECVYGVCGGGLRRLRVSCLSPVTGLGQIRIEATVLGELCLARGWNKIQVWVLIRRGSIQEGCYIRETLRDTSV